jgi:integrase
VDTVTSGDVLGVINVRAKTAVESALRLRHTIEQVLSYAQVRNHIAPGAPNAAALTEQMAIALPKAADGVHHKSMPHAQAPAFVQRLRDMRAGSVAAHALEFIVLTGTRTGEVRKAVWSEFDLPNKLWTIPAARMLKGSAKKKTPHYVPLTDAMIDILTAMQAVKVSKYVFPGAVPGKALTDNTFQRLMKGPLGITDAVPHLMEAWNGYLAARPANVVPLKNVS